MRQQHWIGRNYFNSLSTHAPLGANGKASVTGGFCLSFLLDGFSNFVSKREVKKEQIKSLTKYVRVATYYALACQIIYSFGIGSSCLDGLAGDFLQRGFKWIWNLNLTSSKMVRETARVHRSGWVWPEVICESWLWMEACVLSALGEGSLPL